MSLLNYFNQIAKKALQKKTGSWSEYDELELKKHSELNSQKKTKETQPLLTCPCGGTIGQSFNWKGKRLWTCKANDRTGMNNCRKEYDTASIKSLYTAQYLAK